MKRGDFIYLVRKMPNKNYIKGRNKEYKQVKLLRENGYDIAQRSAGSHSPIDVFAFKRNTRNIKLIQCKPDSMSQKKRDEILLENSWLNNVFRCEFEVI